MGKPQSKSKMKFLGKTLPNIRVANEFVGQAHHVAHHRSAPPRPHWAHHRLLQSLEVASLSMPSFFRSNHNAGIEGTLLNDIFREARPVMAVVLCNSVYHPHIILYNPHITLI